MKGYQTLFGKNVQNYLYPFFWQHGESHEVLGGYVDKIYRSGMQALCIEARPHPDFVGEKWWSDVDCILSEAKKRDMKLWILDDSHFPTGYANGKIKAEYPQYLKKYINCRRYDVQGPLPQARIDLRLLKGRIWEKPEEDIEVLGVFMAARTQFGAGDPIDGGTLTDITEKMHMEDRLLAVDIPAGAHSIFVVFVTKKGAEQATEDYLNPLVREATQVLIDEVYEPHYAHYGAEFGKTILGFFSDEPRFGNAKGTQCAIGTDMPLPWRDGLEAELGFAPKYLPLLWTEGAGKESEIRFRYMDVVTALYNENFTEVLGGWCSAHGVFYLGHTIEDNGAHARLGYGTGHYFRGQKGMHAAGVDVIGTQIVPGMNYHHDAFSTGGSDGEFYHYALAKLAASAAHLDPLKGGRAMCEAFGAYGWNEGLKAMKWIADALMVRGINYIVPHAFNPNKFPDWDCPPHFYAHGNNPQFRYFPVLSNYMNRVMSVFRDGDYPAKVGLFYPAETEWAGAYMPVEKPCRALTEQQISFDIVSRDYLKEAAVEDGCYRINGHAFEVLILPAGKCLPGDLVPVLAQMAERNVRMIFLEELPSVILGGCDDKLWEKVRAVSACVSLEELGAHLSDCRVLETDSAQKDLVVGEYVRDGKHIYMLFNESVERTLSMDIRWPGGCVYRYDAWTDTLLGDGSSHVELAPYESRIYIVSEEELAVAEETAAVLGKAFVMPGGVPAMPEAAAVLEGASAALEEAPTVPEGTTVVPEEKTAAAQVIAGASGETDATTGMSARGERIPLPEKWTVRFTDSFSYPDFKEVIAMDGPGFVQNVKGFETKAGTAQFACELKLPAVSRALLDLGNVYETAEVFVNGTSAGVKLCRPYVFDVTPLLMEGTNRLAIEVTNTLGTAVRDALSHYLPIEPFGIEGPVTLTVEKRL